MKINQNYFFFRINFLTEVFVTDGQDKSIMWADLHGPDSMQFSVLRSLDGTPSDVAFDPVEQKVYWSSKEKKKVSRSDLVGGSKETVIDANAGELNQIGC